MAKRYMVDERSGCIGVIDTTMERTRNGLAKDDPEVVWYRAGHHVPNPCPHCGKDQGGSWSIDPKASEEARALCDRLNSGAQAVCINCNRASCVCNWTLVMDADERNYR